MISIKFEKSKLRKNHICTPAFSSLQQTCSEVRLQNNAVAISAFQMTQTSQDYKHNAFRGAMVLSLLREDDQLRIVRDISVSTSQEKSHFRQTCSFLSFFV